MDLWENNAMFDMVIVVEIGRIRLSTVVYVKKGWIFSVVLNPLEGTRWDLKTNFC
jgi:hypothetical protein